MKKVIFLMIDSLMPEVLEDCIKNGQAPALQFLKDRGQYWSHCTSVFPTMTATVDCSLITGEYPDQHRIPALIWYKPEERRIINYTNGALPVLKLGFGQCAYDVICSLNDTHLSKNVTTIYEELKERGRTAGSINLIAHRGQKKYKIDLPFLLKLATRSRKLEDEISGPELFTLGRVVRSTFSPPLPWGWDESFFRSYGINDDFAIRMLKHLLQHQLLPDFTMVYLPDNDHQVHRNPRKARGILSKVDQKLQSVLNQFSTWDQALEDYIFIITGDHGQTLVGPTSEHNVNLEELYSGLNITPYGEKSKPENDLLIANNERMAYIYPLKSGVMEEIIERSRQDKRIDVIGWKEKDGVCVYSGDREGKLFYRRGGSLQDIYGASWTVEGEWKVLDLQMKDSSTITYGEYPDGLARLSTALYSQDIPMVALSAKPGYEFKSAYAPTHLNGGSHGSLHWKDSTVPLLISGAGQDQRPFEYPRLVDLKNYIVKLLS
ncbi:alkaline phosphatase family protein [Ammoniphilus sp. YIM 78166]|uniref:alkaline phosphatase family protein n=1 Tax=Ammoniphilus sp. YIM 78166 TaxID=1644106 RepID=UPI00106F9BB8|nr:alkaline phosphatase family protein [Ammoniphilus sp. YIM 78166]